MKTFLVFAMFLIGIACFASGPVLQDCKTASATVLQTIDPVMPAIPPEAVVFYELPFAGTIPELGTPIESAELTGFNADIWHPPVLNSTLWLNYNNKKIEFFDWPFLVGNSQNCMDYKLIKRSSDFYPIAWYDIA